jgi:hypothetical protein
MSIQALRDKINENPIIGMAVAGGVVLVAVIWLVFQGGLFSSGPGFSGDVFVSEDYVTYREGDASEEVQLNSDGLPIARAHVYQYGDNEPFIWYLQRWMPEVVDLRRQLLEGTLPPDQRDVAFAAEFNGIEILDMRPGAPYAGTWWPIDSVEAVEIMSSLARGPDGKLPTRVEP